MATAGRRLIVGVDYGTTFSGISFAMSDAVGIEEVNVLSEWGGAGNTYGFQKQVPSRISYQPNKTWGYFTEPGAVAYCWTKLLLDRHAKRTDFDDQGLDDVDGPGLMQLPPGKTAEDVVTDYLTLLYQHMMKELEKKIGAPILQVTPIQFWLTMPALWSIRAQNATRDAAVKAGFGTRQGDSIHLVREPEAAAIACLNDLIVRGPHPLVEVGNGVLVCDCGGGTVDLATYQVKVASPKLSLEEACVSEGGKCGSTTIDRAFHKLMRLRFGQAFTSLPQHKKGAGSNFMKQFESAKRDFGSSEYSKTHRFHLKMKAEDSRYFDADDDEVLITTEDIRSLFDPVVQKIISLLQQQIGATLSAAQLKVTTIILVGGFGESPYLFTRLKKWCPAGIELLNPPRSWEAICLGAAVRGLEGPIVIRKKSRFHIGTQVATAFRPGIDAESDSYIDPYDGSKKVPGYASWIINRGEIVTPDTVKRQGYCRVWLTGTSKKWTEKLYQSEVAVPPEKIEHHSVTEVGEVEVDLTGVDFSIFSTKEIETPYSFGAVKLYRIEFEFVTVVDDDMGYMYFRAVCNGKQVGQVRLRFGNDEGD